MLNNSTISKNSKLSKSIRIYNNNEINIKITYEIFWIMFPKDCGRFSTKFSFSVMITKTIVPIFTRTSTILIIKTMWWSTDIHESSSLLFQALPQYIIHTMSTTVVAHIKKSILTR